jgi:hypothetical protein
MNVALEGVVDVNVRWDSGAMRGKAKGHANGSVGFRMDDRNGLLGRRNCLTSLIGIFTVDWVICSWEVGRAVKISRNGGQMPRHSMGGKSSPRE